MTINNVTNLKNAPLNTSTVSKNSKTTSTKSYDTYTKKTYTYSDIFQAASKKYNISRDLLEAVALTESSFRANATSYCGAMGIMQLMPATAKSLGVSDGYDPIQNIMGGAKYLSQMLKKYNGNTSLALAAYNGGPGNVAKHNGVPSFCQAYVDKVQGYMKKGVIVPNKTVTVNNNSKSAELMNNYNNSSSSISSNSSSSINAQQAYTKFNQSQLSRVESSLNSNIKTSTDDTTISSDTLTKTDSSKKLSNTKQKEITYSDLFEYAANKFNISKKLLESLAKAESNFNANATSSSGAMGIMQLMPSTAKSLGVTNAYDPVENILGGAKYLAKMLKKYNGNETMAVAAYNGGQGNVAKYKGVPPFCKDFVNKVIINSTTSITIPSKKITITPNNSYDYDDIINSV